VNRGGSWNNNARNCRVSNRNNNEPDNRNNNLGFRLASPAPSSTDSLMASIDQITIPFPVYGTKNLRVR
jgi:hypothetical protein